MTRLDRSETFRRFGLIAVLAVCVPALASAQQGGSHFFFGSSQIAVDAARQNPELVVGRMMAFDRNGNGRVETTELTERMHAVVTRGDANADGALDESEIRTLTRTPLTRNTPQIAGFGNTYGFGEDVGLSSRSHIEGAIEDLRLSNLRKESALEVVDEFMDAVEKSAVDELLSALEGNMAPEKLAEIRRALEDQSNGPAQVVIMPSAAKSIASQRALSMLHLAAGGQKMMLVALQVERIEPALAAVERYKTRLRLNDAERSELVNSLKDTLSEEDRDNFRAAIERRPVVAAGGQVRFASAVTVIDSGIQTFSIEKTVR
jgi:hypothetical protein